MEEFIKKFCVNGIEYRVIRADYREHQEPFYSLQRVGNKKTKVIAYLYRHKIEDGRNILYKFSAEKKYKKKNQFFYLNESAIKYAEDYLEKYCGK